MADTDKDPPPAPGGSLWPTYTLRAWLTTLLVQTQQADVELKHRIEDKETELDRLREQAKRSGPVIQQLQEALDRVDAVLKRKLDTERSKQDAKESVPPPSRRERETETKSKK